MAKMAKTGKMANPMVNPPRKMAILAILTVLDPKMAQNVPFLAHFGDFPHIKLDTGNFLAIYIGILTVLAKMAKMAKMAILAIFSQPRLLSSVFLWSKSQN